jgi:hypothetical protein
MAKGYRISGRKSWFMSLGRSACMLAAALWIPGPAFGQNNLTTVTTSHVDIDETSDLIDGVAFLRAEIMMSINWSSPEGQSMPVAAEDEYIGVQGRPHQYAELPTLWEFQECAPYDMILGSGEIYELDESILGGVMVGVVGIVVGILGFLAEAGSAGAATWAVVSIGGSVMGIVIGVNSDDHVGTLTPRAFPIMPAMVPETHGDDIEWKAVPNPLKETEEKPGNPRVWVNIDSVPVGGRPASVEPGMLLVLAPDDGVCPPPPNLYLMGFDEVRGRFAELREAYLLVGQIDNEPGTGTLTPEGIESAKESVGETLLGTAALVAGSLVEVALPYVGGDTALEFFLTAQKAHLGGDAAAALDGYEEATVAAYDAAYFDPIPAAANGIVDMPDTLLMTTSVMSAPSTAGDSFMLGGRVLGLDAGDSIVQVSIDDITTEGLETRTFGGSVMTGVAADGGFVDDLEIAGIPNLEPGNILGLNRFSAAAIDGPDAGCSTQHLVDGTQFQTGVFFDELGPFFDPDPTGCSFGQVVEFNGHIVGGGVPFGASFVGGAFSAVFQLDPGSAIPPGRYDLTVRADVEDAGQNMREVTAPLTLVVPTRQPAEIIFQNGFFSGDTSIWSSVVP